MSDQTGRYLRLGVAVVSVAPTFLIAAPSVRRSAEWTLKSMIRLTELCVQAGIGVVLSRVRGDRVTTDEGEAMADIDVDELGPVDYLVVRFPEGKANFSGEMATQLKALIDARTVRVLDLITLTKAADGSIEAAELRDVDDSELGELRGLERDLAVLMAEEDLEEIGELLDPSSAAAVLVYENSWAAPFASSIRRSGGELVAAGRIPTQALIAAVEAERQTERKES